MTIKNMTDLVHLYDTINILWEMHCQLAEKGTSLDDLMAELLKVSDVIKRESTLYQKGVDREDSPVAKVLENTQLSAQERARRLMTSTSENSKGLKKTEASHNYLNNPDCLPLVNSELTNLEPIIEILTILIRVYDASNELLDMCKKLAGHTLDSNSIASRLLCLPEAIKRFSPLHDPEEDWGDSSVCRILEQKDLSEEERARKLLGLV